MNISIKKRINNELLIDERVALDVLNGVRKNNG